MFDLITDGDREKVHDHLPDKEKCGSEKDIAQRPSVVKGIHDQYNLKDDIDEESDTIHDEIKHPQYGGVSIAERSKVIKCGYGDQAYDEEHHEGADTDGLRAGVSFEKKYGALCLTKEKNNNSIGFSESAFLTQSDHGVPSSAN